MYVKIVGRASTNVVNQLSGKNNIIKNVYTNNFYFLDYSNFSIPINTVFSCFAEAKSETINSYQIQGKVILVTQEYGLLYEQIPYGHKTICKILFDEFSYNFIKTKIPIVDYWNVNNSNFFLATFELTFNDIKGSDLIKNSI